MQRKRLRVVIVGGGIGGLFAANALTARGLDVSVHEQAPALGEIGAGVFLTPEQCAPIAKGRPWAVRGEIRREGRRRLALFPS